MHSFVLLALAACVASAQTSLDDEYADMVAKRHALVGHEATADVWQYFREAWPCPTTRRYGTLGDGGKWLCFVRPHCTVLSLGISNEFSFEAELHDRHNCTVHGFDPTVEPSLDVLRVMRFHHRGVRSGLADDPVAAERDLSVWEMLYQANLTRVDVLKVDVEGAEFGMLDELFADYEGHPLPFDQLLVEFHLRPISSRNAADLRVVVEQLEERGFRLFESEYNPDNPECCAELAFVHKDAYAREFRVWQLLAQALRGRDAQ
jgi:hypothetical protein